MHNDLLELAKNLTLLGYQKHSGVVSGLAKTAGTITDVWGLSASGVSGQEVAALRTADNDHQANVMEIQAIIGASEDGQFHTNTKTKWDAWIDTNKGALEATLAAVVRPDTLQNVIAGMKIGGASPPAMVGNSTKTLALAKAIQANEPAPLKTHLAANGFQEALMPEAAAVPDETPVVLLAPNYYFQLVKAAPPVEGGGAQSGWYVVDASKPDQHRSAERAMTMPPNWNVAGTQHVYFSETAAREAGAISKREQPSMPGAPPPVVYVVDKSKVKLYQAIKRTPDGPMEQTEVANNDIAAHLQTGETARLDEREAARGEDWTTVYVKRGLVKLREGIAISSTTGAGRGFTAREVRRHMTRMMNRKDWNDEGMQDALSEDLASRLTQAANAVFIPEEGTTEQQEAARGKNYGVIFAMAMSTWRRRSHLDPRGWFSEEGQYGAKVLKDRTSLYNPELEYLHKVATKRLKAEQAATKRRDRVRAENR